MAFYPTDPHYLAEHPSGKKGNRLRVRTAEQNAVLPWSCPAGRLSPSV